LKEKCLCENTVNSILYYVEFFRNKLTSACEIEHGNLKQSQDKIKHWYEKDAMIREFKTRRERYCIIAYSLSSITS
jgi:hypothetical protein